MAGVGRQEKTIEKPIGDLGRKMSQPNFGGLCLEDYGKVGATHLN